MNPLRLLPALLLATSLAHAVPACSYKTFWIKLELTATGREPAAIARIAIGPDGCAMIELLNGQLGSDPAARTLQLTSSELTTLQNLVNAVPATAFNASYLQSQIATRYATSESNDSRGTGGLGGVINGDQLALTIQVSGLAQSIAWYGLYFDQSRYPDIAELTALANLSRPVRALSLDARLQDVTP